MMYKIYLDACCLNRPFDDWAQERVRLEADSILSIMERIRAGQWQLVASEAIAVELGKMVNEFLAILIRKEKSMGTPLELREKGYQALVEQLGVDAIRFLQQVGWGHGDYTQERREVLYSVSREEFW